MIHIYTDKKLNHHVAYKGRKSSNRTKHEIPVSYNRHSITN